MPRNFPKALFDLVGSLYEIAQETSAERWSEAFDKLTELVNCGPGSMVVLPTGAEAFELLCHNLPQAALTEYQNYYYQVSPLRHLIFAIEPGQSFTRKEKIADDEWIHSEFYDDYLKKYGLFNYRYDLLFRSPHASAGVMFSKPRSSPDFTDEETRMIDLVSPHLGRAYELHLSLARANDKSEMIESAIDRIPRNVVLVDLSGKVILANEGARTLLDQNDGMTIAPNVTLQLSSAAEHRRFRSLVRSAIGPIILEKAERGGTLHVSRPSGRRPFEVLVSPVAADKLARATGNNLAVVFISDPEEMTGTVAEVLVALYDLTPTEARVASLLTDGNGIDQIGDLLSITENTVKTHLKHIFSKTETSRQSELIKLILRGPATIKPNNHNK